MVTSDLIEMREKVFDLLKGTPFRVVIFNEVSPSLVGISKRAMTVLVRAVKQCMYVCSV